MADVTCQGCGTKRATTSGVMHKCDKCGKILCDKCRGTKLTPCSSVNTGTPRCSGTYRKP